MRITICGAGNAAQTLAALLAGQDMGHEVVIYAPLGDEASRLHALTVTGICAEFADGRTQVGWPALVTADPAAAGQDAEIVLLALPAFAHESVLRALAPHLSPYATIGALPARGGFDWLVQTVLPAHQGVLFGLQTLPWACRIMTWGRHVHVLGVKAQVDLAAWPAERAADVAAALGALIGVPLRPVHDFLALTLANMGQIIHPGIMYGYFHAWDGRPFASERIPLFYGNVDERTADLLQTMSDEIQMLCRALERSLPALDLGCVPPVYTWLLDAYAGQIDDPGCLHRAFNTNRAYAGIHIPVRPGNAGYLPDFSARYLSEDIPYSLLVSRGIADLAGVPMPMVSRVIGWAQERIQREYLVGGRVAGKDVIHSRAPQRFGITTLDALRRSSMHVQAEQHAARRHAPV